MRSIVVNDEGRHAVRAVRGFGLAFAALTLLALPASAVAQTPALAKSDVQYVAGREVSITGAVVSRQSDTLLVRDETTHRLSLVTITSGTRVIEWTGFLSLDKRARTVAALIPGLLITVRGFGGQRGDLEAEAISFHNSSMRTATQISAGEVELKAEQRQTAALVSAGRDSLIAAYGRAQDSIDVLNSRLSALDAYDVALSATVRFEPGSTELDEHAKAALDVVAMKVQGLRGYLIEVAGYSDSSGSGDLDQRLSTARAHAVVAYLAQAHSLPLRRLVNPTGMGASHPVASNDSAEGRAQNRRAVVSVMVNRGLRARREP